MVRLKRPVVNKTLGELHNVNSTTNHTTIISIREDAVERRQKSLKVDLKLLVIYYDNFAEIIDCLKVVFSEISINTEDYNITNIDEIKEIRKAYINSFVIKSRDPYISVNLDISFASIYISEDNALQRGVLEKIRCILDNKTRKLAWLANNAFLAGGTAGASLWFFVNAAIHKNHLPKNLHQAAVVMPS